MITCKEDLIGTYVLTSNKEVLKLFIEACEKFDIYWYSGRKASDPSYEDEFFIVCREEKALFRASYEDIEGYRQLTLADFIHSENALQSPVDNVNIDTHIHTLEENKRSTGTPMPFIVEDGSVSDTRKDIFKEILTLARENDCFTQFDGFTEDENDSIVVTFASSDDEYVVKSIDEFRELVSSINTTQKFLRNQ
ncbi:TPA: hypothetical protein PFD71_003271 [Vibrio cholerae]|uniref:hypothetical protein n=1 Tax=Vibrio cholerae TaxID=666 RepID=UPI000EB6F3EF|nr:hypothetical protein ICP12012A_033 [Vibrio phage ICP1_2012_A]QHB43538.1 hypothetical protein CJFNICFP_00186 [Vibrio phage VMJ710]QVW04536.1 hypothetical protein 2018Mat001_0200 [Vibrio phage ICP1]WOZ53671.1 hypothetical protein [Vibrio phage VRU]HAT7621088.1 hypothetical protein [Vibrio cholerae O1]HDG1611381.1 hypothetical protein [Vibrio cholerae]